MRSLSRLLRGWARRGGTAGSDEHIRWLVSVHGGFLAPGNVRAFEHVVRNPPDGGATASRSS